MLPMVAPNAARRTSISPDIAKSCLKNFRSNGIEFSSRRGVERDFVVLHPYRERFRLKNNLLPIGKIGFASPPGQFSQT